MNPRFPRRIRHHSPQGNPVGLASAPRKLPVYMLLMICLLLVIPVVQHLTAQIDLLRSGVVVYWGDNESITETFGFQRYSKDITSLFVVIIGVILMANSKAQQVQWLMKKCLVLILLTLGLGMVGHLLQPELRLIMVGLRWVMHTVSAIGVCLVILEYDLWNDGRFRAIMATSLLTVLVCNAGFIFLQERQQEGFSRYTGLFSNSGVMGLYVVGLALALEFVLRRSLILCNAAYAIALYSSVRSGSRTAMIVVLLLWLLFVIRKVSRSSNVLLITCAPLLAWGAWYSFRFAESTADRGSIIGDQLVQGGRISNIISFGATLNEVSLMDIICGRGFGFGTNGAFGYTQGVNTTHPWLTLIDNGYVTWFIQFGLVGLILLGFIVSFWCRLLWNAAIYMPSKRPLALVCMVLPMLLMMVQNVFEQLGLLGFIGITVSWLLSPDATHSRPQS